jgi:hypothetical protein
MNPERKNTTMEDSMPTVWNLAFNMAVFGVVTLLIYAACMAMVRIVDRKQARRRRNR